MIKEVFRNRLREKLRPEKTEEGVGFSILLIVSIIGAVVQIINCMKSKELRAGASKARIARAIRQKTDLGLIDSRKAAAKIMELTDEASDTELQELFDEARE